MTAPRLDFLVQTLRATLLALVVLLGGCGAFDATVAAPVVAPSWERTAFVEGDADLVGGIDLAAMRADPVFGPLIALAARKGRLGVLTRASQIDALASFEEGRPKTWVVVVHGVEGPPTRADVDLNLGEVVTAPGAWILGEGSAFERVRATPGLAPARVVLPARALVASTIRGSAFPSSREPVLADLTAGLESVSTDLLGGPHLEMVMECRYADATAARHAATAAKLLLVAAAERTDAVAALARTLVQTEFEASGDTVSVRVTVSDELRDLLRSYVERAEP